MKRISLLILTIGVICGATRVFAGGPFTVDEVGRTGAACQWTGNKLSWSYDEGILSPTINNAKAVGWVRDAMTAWTTVQLPNKDGTMVATADIAQEEVGSVGEDITADNLETYLGDTSGTAAVIVFDNDGSIMAALGFDAESTLGISQPLALDASGLKITRGIVILNGKILDFLATKVQAGYTAEDLFKAALTHEVGHLFNLDHTQINLDLAEACTLGGTCTGGQNLPTMFPELKSYRQGTLSYDDRITMSWIYPNADFQSQFCTITGEITDASGNPLQGVNVIARQTAGTSTPRVDARSQVSGVLYPSCTSDGHYYLHGIIPGKTYAVSYEALAADPAVGASGFEPLDSPPSGFEAGTIAKGSATTVKCVAGGETIAMDPVQLTVTNPCTTTTAPGSSTTDTSGSEGDTGAPGSSGSKCSLSAHETMGASSVFGTLLIIAGLVCIIRARNVRRVS